MRTKYTEEQKAAFVKGVDDLRAQGMPSTEACIKMAVSVFNYFRWRRPKRARVNGAPKKHRSKEEIIEILKAFANRGDVSMVDWATSHGISLPTLNKWRKQYGDNPIADAREIVQVPNGNTAELKILRIENQRLKMLIADKCLDIMSLQEYVEGGRK